ncbi:hypothetical protein BWI93_01520 [Siphonobacter sp. BAB-5385]|uniref:hypothetical protein n=1 Tax=Siphonobacter sp. BAB-5385 TaxID=1864822 RepID=UPI000B9E7F03|nr:hypothetical protein [Siphonobacter sp. BAB-5385]OZI09858.1 hypothetical protein BWI93_01520 [Siphonobacter sp. BAB-5385]
MENIIDNEEKNKDESYKIKSDLEIDKIKKEIHKIELENEKILEEKNKLVQEANKVKEESLKIRREREDLEKAWYKKITAETLGKILLGASVMAFSYTLFVQPYFKWREDKLSYLADSLKNELSNKRGELGLLNQKIDIQNEKLTYNKLESEKILRQNKILNKDNAKIKFNNNKLKVKADTLTLKEKRFDVRELVVYYIANDLESKFDLKALEYFDDRILIYDDEIAEVKDYKGYKDFIRMFSDDFYELIYRHLYIGMSQLEAIIENKQYNFSEKDFAEIKSSYTQYHLEGIERYMNSQLRVSKKVRDRNIWNILKKNLLASIKVRLHSYKNEFNGHIRSSDLKELKRIESGIRKLLPSEKNN